jgi:hypothetical protein
LAAQQGEPFFARAFVNRVWAAYFQPRAHRTGDDINLANPPVNAELMDYLAGDFVAHGYDMKRLHRLILNSDTYQRSWRPNPSNERDERNFSRFMLRRLPAEVLLDATTLATAASDRQRTFADDVAGRQIGPNVAAFGLAETFAGRNVPDYALTVFGKPVRETNCDCERATMPTLLQALYLRNDPEMLARIENQRAESPAWISQLRAANSSAEISSARIDQLIVEVFLRTVSRPSTGEEMQQARADIARASDPIGGVRTCCG